MGRAMIGGIISSGLVPASHLIASAKTQVTLDTLSEQYGIRTTLDNETVAVESDIIFLAVKPYLYETVIKEIKDSVTDDKIIVAIAAGQTISRIESLFSKDIKLVRTMPNTPAMVQEAMSAITPNEHITEEETKMVVSLFESFGKAEIVPESLMDAVVRSVVPHRLMSICLLKQWLTQLLMTVCRVPRLTNLLPSPFLVQLKWY